MAITAISGPRPSPGKERRCEVDIKAACFDRQAPDRVRGCGALFCCGLPVTTGITTSNICLWFARGAGFLLNGFSGGNVRGCFGNTGLFDCCFGFRHMADTRLRAFCARACLWRGNKACIGISQIVEARHQAGLWIVRTRISPVIAAGVGTRVWTRFRPVFAAVFWPRLISRLLPVFRSSVWPVFVAIFVTIFRALIAAIIRPGITTIVRTGLFRTGLIVARLFIARLVIAVIAVVALPIPAVGILLVAVLLAAVLIAV